MVSAAELKIATCHICAQLNRLVTSAPSAHCARCGARLHLRKPQSLQRTVALLAAGLILYIPANLLPIMHTSTITYAEDDTIMSGVVALWRGGSWPLALLVFFVSILVPSLKLIALSILVACTHYGSAWRLRERTALFRLIEFVGRWSMLDVFVVSLLVALVQLRGLASIHAGPGAIAFAGVVIVTMYAAQAFDPRLMWDQASAHSSIRASSRNCRHGQ